MFFKNLRKAIKYGLTEEAALKALTYNPANFINQYDKVGSLEKGKLANFIITSDNLFSPKTKIYENWIQGKKYLIENYNVIDASGNYSLNIAGKTYDLKVKGDPKKLSGNIEVIIEKDTNKVKVDVKIESQLVAVSFNPNDDYQKGTIRLSGTISSNGGIWDGNGQLPHGNWIKWTAIKGKSDKKKSKKSDTKEAEQDSLIIPRIQYPNMAYGFDSLPKATTILIKNTTVWTNEAEGILKNTDVLLQNGKIATIGKDLTVADAVIKAGLIAGLVGVAAFQIATISQQEFADGGLVERYQEGGLLKGPLHTQGGIPAIVAGGRMIEMEGDEFIMKRSAVRRIGVENLNALNEGSLNFKKFQTGGLASANFGNISNGFSGTRRREIADSNKQIFQVSVEESAAA